MEGRTTVRPVFPLVDGLPARVVTFNGGPDNRPASRLLVPTFSDAPTTLQWRAGQSSGQSRQQADVQVGAGVPSMEGRTIVRPVSDAEAVDETSDMPSMEGRTIVRPVLLVFCERDISGWPSMEGRTIVRPVQTLTSTPPIDRLPFNGGPDNRPASLAALGRRPNQRNAFNGGPDNRPASLAGVSQWSYGANDLQWRAGQSSGQSNRFHSNRDGRRPPSMEGRTIVRPVVVRHHPNPRP